MQTVFVLDETSKKMVSGNLDHKILLDNRDEMGQVVGAFNKIADALYHFSKIVQHSSTPPSPPAALRGEQEYCYFV
ncbi:MULTISPECIES: HAMP domain-containing protein [unclassified Microcoleus]|uniref:HAMP domain-containing protein n=1 Tax=unclassified Microcoleus TaxID=2642155 RepID=UPI002FD6B269